MRLLGVIVFIFILGACGQTPPPVTALTLWGSHRATPIVRSSFFRIHDLLYRSLSRTVLAATRAGSPLQLKFNVHSLFVSPKEDCSDPTLVLDYGTATEKVLTNEEPLFQGVTTSRGYPCVMMEIDDTLTFVPDATAVSAWPSVCNANTEYRFDLYRTDDSNWKDIGGNTITPHGSFSAPVTDTVYLFASTDAAAAKAARGLNGNQVSQMTSEIVIPGVKTFYIDTANQITAGSEVGYICRLHSPTIGFR